MAKDFFPYISFRGNGRKAFAYYQSIFGGELHLQDYPEVGEGQENPFPFTPPEGALAHGLLDAGWIRITGGDGIGESLPSLESEVYSFMIQCETVAEAEELIAKFLQSESSVKMPFMKAPWGSHYGQILDPFGVMWAFHAE